MGRIGEERHTVRREIDADACTDIEAGHDRNGTTYTDGIFSHLFQFCGDIMRQGSLLCGIEYVQTHPQPREGQKVVRSEPSRLIASYSEPTERRNHGLAGKQRPSPIVTW
jgi:hypothetical protein